MKLHANAALSLNQRRRLARRIDEQGWSPSKAAGSHEVSQPTARKWARRYRSEGEAGLLDRPSAANRVWNRTPDAPDLRGLSMWAVKDSNLQP